MAHVVKRLPVYARSMRVLCLNHRDELDRLMFQSQRRTQQHSTDRCVARVHVLRA